MWYESWKSNGISVGAISNKRTGTCYQIATLKGFKIYMGVNLEMEDGYGVLSVTILCH